MDKKTAQLTVISGDPDQGPRRRLPGHYFDQTIFDLHYSLQGARARRMAMEEDLARLGIEIDPATGEVRLKAKP